MTAKRITSFLIALILTLSLAACGAKGDTYRDDVSVGTLSDAIEAKIPVTGGYSRFSDLLLQRQHRHRCFRHRLLRRIQRRQ